LKKINKKFVIKRVKKGAKYVKAQTKKGYFKLQYITGKHYKHINRIPEYWDFADNLISFLKIFF